jgi:uncharacterized protein
MARALNEAPAWRWVAVAVPALLFGLAHAGGGAVAGVLAGAAGLGYGLAYAWTRRIETAIVVHFGVNALHFVGFTYPYLKP